MGRRRAAQRRRQPGAAAGAAVRPATALRQQPQQPRQSRCGRCGLAAPRALQPGVAYLDSREGERIAGGLGERCGRTGRATTDGRAGGPEGLSRHSVASLSPPSAMLGSAVRERVSCLRHTSPALSPPQGACRHPHRRAPGRRHVPPPPIGRGALDRKRAGPIRVGLPSP
jgi:hypothetical protein